MIHLVCPASNAQALFSVSLETTIIPRLKTNVIFGGEGAKEGQTRFIMGDVQMANAWFFLKH